MDNSNITEISLLQKIKNIPRNIEQFIVSNFTREPEYNALLEILLANIHKDGKLTEKPELLKEEYHANHNVLDTFVIVRIEDTLYGLAGFQNPDNDRTKFFKTKYGTKRLGYIRQCILNQIPHKHL